jgi:hypothetical protein
MQPVEQSVLDAQVQRLRDRGFVTTWRDGLLQAGWKVEKVPHEAGSEPLEMFTDGASIVEYPDGWVVRWLTRRTDLTFHETPSLEASVDLVLSVYEGVKRD